VFSIVGHYFFVRLVGFIFVATGVQIAVYMEECALSYHL